MVIKSQTIGKYTVTLRRNGERFTVSVNDAKTSTKHEIKAFCLYEDAVRECEKEVNQS